MVISNQDLRYKFVQFAAAASGDDLAVKQAISSIHKRRNSAKSRDNNQKQLHQQKVTNILSGSCG